MKLRIARKLDPGNWQRRARYKSHDRKYRQKTYADRQLHAAWMRLHRAWRRHRASWLEDDKLFHTLTPDWFAGNRVESRLIRQISLRSMRLP